MIGIALLVSDYAEAYKVTGPTETCEEPELNPVQSCGDKVILQGFFVFVFYHT